MRSALKTIVVGCGNMGSSHARAYAAIDGFELIGVVDANSEKSEQLAHELKVPHQFSSIEAALALKPDVVAICTYPDSHAQFARQALEAGAHIFVEKPIAATVDEAIQIAQIAHKLDRKLVVGYILRHHPAWEKFCIKAHELGKPLVMRMNLNQQSVGYMWDVHKNLMKTMSPIVDCGVHYVDAMCQMTRSKPIRVYALGARLTDQIDPTMYNYGMLQVLFEDGSIGWYEAGWGPMMSEEAFFVKDVVGPKGCLSIVKARQGEDAHSSDINSHTQTNSIRIHHAQQDASNEFIYPDEWIDMSDEPDHQELCNREQRFLLNAIHHNVSLENHWTDAVNSLRIVLAADQSIRTGLAISLD